MKHGKQVYYKKSRLKKLRAFCVTAQVGNFSKAAAQLNMSQPTISLQIQALEQEFDAILFERKGAKIQLTPEGETLFKLSQPLVQGIDKLQETFTAQYGNMDSGELKLAAGESTILYVLAEPVRQYAAEYPKVHLTLANVTGRDGLAMLHADEVDVAVGSMLEVPDEVIYEPLVTYNPTLIAPLDHPLAKKRKITIQDISNYGLILPPRHLSTWRIVDMVFQQHDLEYKVALEAGGWEVIKKYVEIGMGISIVTDVCLTGNEQVARFPLDDYFPKRTYGIVRRRGRFLSPQALRFMEMIREHYLNDVLVNPP